MTVQAPQATARIAPGTSAQIGRRNALIATVIGWAIGSDEPPRLFTTLSRHRRLYGPWLRFAGALMPGGKLRRVDSELVILRVAHNSSSEYEWRHHERLGVAAGLSPAQVQAVRGEDRSEFDERQLLLLGAADELHEQRVLSDELWERLRARFSEVELIELCMLVGHYEMLAMTLNSLRVQPDEFGSSEPPLIGRLVARLAARRARS